MKGRRVEDNNLLQLNSVYLIGKEGEMQRKKALQKVTSLYVDIYRNFDLYRPSSRTIAIF